MTSKPAVVRYIVNDVDAAIQFYTKMLGFKLEMHPASEFAILSRDNLRLLLSKPSTQGGGVGCQTEASKLQEAGTGLRSKLKI